MVSSSILVNGLGDEQINFNTFTASYSNTASYSRDNTVNSSSYSISSSYANFALSSVSSSNSISSSYAISSSIANSLNGINDFFEKDNSNNVLFTAVNSQSLSLGMGLMVYVNNNAILFSSGSSVTMPTTLLAGNDYGVYATYDNKLIATYTNTGSNPMDGYTVPVGYNTNNSRLIGGFYFSHTGSTPLTTISRSRSNNVVTLTLSSTGSLKTNDVVDVTIMTDITYDTFDIPITVGGGNTISFTNSGSNESNIVDTAGDIWKVNNTGYINQYSCWDLKFRPLCLDPRGMVLVDNRFWVDIWLTGNNYINTGTSRKGQRIADGESAASYPLVSTKMGGTGANNYGNCTWFTATEVIAHWGKQLLSYADYCVAAYGTHEAASFGTDAQFTCKCGDFTSKWGMEQASGVMFILGSDLNYKFDHNTSVASTFRSRDSSSVATITSSVHGLSVGDIITVTGFSGTPGTTYNRSLVTIQSVPSTTTFTYNCVSGSTPEPLTSAAGTISSGLPVFNYQNVAGGRGQIYIQGPQGLVAGLYGGSWLSGASAGSRFSSWSYYVWSNGISVGLRGRCGHIVVP
jgi:hypothetical protein